MRFEGKADLLHLAVRLSGSREGIGIADIQRDLDVSHRTAQRMLAALRERFIDLEEVDGDERAKRWRLRNHALKGLMGANSSELVELEAAARRLREEGAAAGRAEALESLASKLRAAMKADDLRRAEPDVEALMQAEGTAIRPGPRPIVPATLLSDLRDAILGFKKLRLRYSANGTRSREHVVEPLGLLHGPRPYLVAQISCKRQEPTVFRLDRIRDATPLDEPFQLDPAFSLRGYVQRSFGIWQEEPIDVCLRFTRDVAAEASRFHFHSSQQLELQADGSLLVRFSAGGALEMCQHLATWEDTVEILEPASLREQLSSWARKIADHHAIAPVLGDPV